MFSSIKNKCGGGGEVNQSEWEKHLATNYKARNGSGGWITLGTLPP